MVSEPIDSRRVFISYSWDSQAHQDWVYELAVRLTNDGVVVVFDQWDTDLGSDLAAFMESGLTSADRVIVVSSAEYVKKANGSRGGAGYEKRIMTAQILKDLTSNRVVPLIRNNDSADLMPTFLGPAKYVDFRDDSQFEEKYQELIHDLYERKQRPRPPLGKSPFAATEDEPRATGEVRPLNTDQAPLWQALPVPVTPLWRSDVFARESRYSSGNTLVEVELVPIEPQRLEVRQLQTLPDKLADIGRQSGVFTGTQGLESQSTPDAAWVRLQNDPKWNENGLLATRSGQRGFWLTVPHDGLGTILDESDLTRQFTTGLKALSIFPMPTPTRFAIGVKLGPFSMVSLGQVADLGHRNSATMGGLNNDPIELVGEDSVSTSNLASKPEEIAAELAARLIAHFKVRPY